ncbi:glycosyl hydrolase [Caldicellulosiruptor acetigenus]|uniref:Glycoside hydrolase family 26 n=1 Tax=Caldicellulosiruptor acetigenus 6A TaxID=632516 RepID=G2PWR9_9FIRM|nr:glycosyl hydrolase [Caldicellulosiruptor acetigenus]AEM74724.1 glycoside hydrolase family 26 [Caldicellulosiruptor acetigenus 6A]
MRKGLKITSLIVSLVFLLGLLPTGIFGAVETSVQSYVFDFEDGTTMTFGEAWGDSLKCIKKVSVSTDLQRPGNKYALRLDVEFNENNGWDQGDLGAWIGGVVEGQFDFTNYKSVEFEMFVPYDEFAKAKGGFAYKVVLNDGWKELGSEFSITVNAGKKVKINGKDYMVIHKAFAIPDDFRTKKRAQLVFQFAGQNCNYKGPIYLDNIRVRPEDASNLSKEDYGSSEEEEISEDFFTGVTLVYPQEGKNFVYNFEKDTMGFYKYSGDGFAKKTKSMEFSQDLKTSTNAGSLKLNANFQGTAFEEMNIAVKLTDKEGKLFDLGKYSALEYTIYIPNPDKVAGKIMSASAVDSPWKIIKDFTLLNYKDKTTWKEINGKTYAVIKCKDNLYNVKEKAGVLVLRIAGSYVKYTGPIYIDNVTLIAGKKVAPKVERISLPNPKTYYKVKIEAESASDGWAYSVEKENAKFSGKGYVLLFGNNMGNTLYNIKVPKTGHYIFTLAISTLGLVKDGSIDIWIDGDLKGGAKVPNVKGKFQEVVVRKKIYLTAGEHTISLQKSGGYTIAVDYFVIEELVAANKSKLSVSSKLVTPNPHPNAQRLINYLSSIYGEKILSGQQSSGEGKEVQMIFDVTKRYPAVRSFDFMDYSPSRVQHGTRGTDVDEAIKWWKSGGIVAFCWHWNAPTGLIDQPGKEWWRGFYTEATTFDLKKAMDNPNSEEYKLILRDIDAIAEQLKKLQAEGVPVLFRPLHEASGGWFWWGAKGPEPYIKLWKLMFDRLVNYHKINNLIWVWNGQDAAWYPGDQYVDIIAEDIYEEKAQYSPYTERFVKALKYTNANKMIALSECGTIPDPAVLKQEGVSWLWFSVWAGSYVMTGSKYNDEWNDNHMLRKIYNNDYVITKDELPDIKSIPLK